MRKRLLGILASAAVIVSACGGASSSSAPPASAAAPGESTTPVTSGAPSASAGGLPADAADQQVLHIDLGQEPATLDPSKGQTSDAIAVIHALQRPLVYFDKDLKVVPSLAESYDVSADAKTITFHLRDAKYSDGNPIVADDLVYSWKRLADPRTAAPYAYVMGEVAGTSELISSNAAVTGDPNTPQLTDAQIEADLAKVGVAAPDPKTFVVTLSTPATYFLTAASLWVFGPLEKKWIESPNATEAANYVSSGPYILDTWKHNSEIILKPNPNWYGPKSLLSEITMTMTKEPAQAQAAFEAGELDMVRPPTEDITRVKADPTLGPMVSEQPTFAITYYDFNNAKGPTKNKEFRIALTQAIDKKAFIDATFSGTGEPANTMIMPGIPGYNKDLDPYPYDVAAAKTHMATALQQLGVSDVAALGKLKLGFNTGGNHEGKVAFMAEAWRQAFGLQTEQIGVEWSTFTTQRTQGVFDIARDGWSADYPHANNQLSGIWTCKGGNNNAQYCNKDFDALVQQAAVEPDQDKQIALYQQAEKLMIEEAPALFLRYGLATNEVQPYVGGIQATGTDSQLPGDTFYETIYIKQH
jgi:ABC-type transport system substrate-binding protein